MRFWFDTEFIENGRTIDLMSIGIVAEDGRKLYVENIDCDLSMASDWVKQNVIPHLGKDDPVRLYRKQIQHTVRAFVGEYPMTTGPAKPEFWAYYADYDWVALCQLFGTMMDLPKGWPMLAYDFRQWLDMHGKQEIRQPKRSDSHHALADAVWLASAFREHGPK